MSLIWPFGAIAVTLALALFLLGALRKRSPGRVIDGWQVVEWGAAMRGLSIVLCVLISAAALFVIESAHADPLRLICLVALIVLSLGYVLFFWRNWIKYREGVVIVGSMWKSPQTFQLSGLQFTGSIGARGHEYSTANGGTIFINSYQRGAGALMDLISRSDRKI
jgi:hypothetical protein